MYKLIRGDSCWEEVSQGVVDRVDVGGNYPANMSLVMNIGNIGWLGECPEIRHLLQMCLTFGLNAKLLQVAVQGISRDAQKACSLLLVTLAAPQRLQAKRLRDFLNHVPEAALCGKAHGMRPLPAVDLWHG